MKSDNTSGRADRRLQRALTLVGISGIVLSFVPFTSNVIPFTDVLLHWQYWDSLLIMAAPCIILPVPICLGYALYLVAGRLPRWAVSAGYSLSAIFAIAILIDIGITIRPVPEDVLLGLLFVTAFCGAAWLSIKGVRNDSFAGGLIAMQCVYAIPMTYYLVFFAGDYQIGGWLGLITLVAYLVQIRLAVKRPAWLLVLIIPIACFNLLLIWIVWT